MKRKLTAKEYTYVASMLFGLFFGAGNLIFPVHLGQMAGSNVWQAILGLLITGVGLPLLGVAALGISRSNGLFDLSSKVNRPYAMFFTCALYLTIGPFFAIPRCATTSFTVGLEQVLPQNGSNTLYLLLFSVAFFAAALFFALRPGKILTWVGKILNPCFLVFLAILVVVALLSPSAAIADVEPLGDLRPSRFSLVSSKGTTPWTRWRVLPSASSSCRSSVTSAWTIPPLWRGAPSARAFSAAF